MKKIVYSILVILVTLTLCSCTDIKKTQQQTQKNIMKLNTENTESIVKRSLAETQLQLNIELLKKLSKHEKNIFFSGVSINSALTMSYFGAAEQTKSEMNNVLGYGDLDDETVANLQQSLLKDYEDTGEVKCANANAIWIDKGLQVEDKYTSLIKSAFESEVNKINFQSNQASDTINKWVNKNTQGMIKKLFEENNNLLLQDAKLVITNAIYFNGEWTEPFSDQYVQMQFKGVNKSSKVDMMHRANGTIGYECEEYKLVKLKYGTNERFEMQVILPEKDIVTFVENLSVNSLTNILQTAEEKEQGQIVLPIFELESSIELNEILQNLGIKSAFSTNANFSGMTKEKIYVDTILHKAKIKVDEKGTEASASTGIVNKMGVSSEEAFEFIADKPFLFFIVDKKNDSVLFTGVINDLG